MGKGEGFKADWSKNSGCIWEAQLIAVRIVQEKGITGLDGDRKDGCSGGYTCVDEI